MFCMNCGKEIADNSAFCPHCGKPQKMNANGNGDVAGTKMEETAQTVENKKQEYNTSCVLGMIIGLIAMLFVPGGLSGLIVIIISAYGIVDARKKKEKGTILAVIGLLMGLIATVP